MIDSLQKVYSTFLKGGAICTDSRAVTKGCIFFALKGPNFNGNLFANSALASGAALVVADEPATGNDPRIIHTANTLAFLQQLALHHRQHLAIPVIAITGSNGKTTTKELFHRVLSMKYHTACTKGNLNNHIGVPLTLLGIGSQHEAAIIEMGANHQKEIELLCSLALPTHVLITNVGKAHLEGFGGFEGVKRGKGEMYDFARENNALVFINNDNPHLNSMLGDYTHRFRYGTSAVCEVHGKLITGGTYVSLRWQKKDGSEWHTVNSSLPGLYNFENILSAITAGVCFGVSPEDIERAIRFYIPDNQRSQEIVKGSNTIILDAYNANPTSMEAALNHFSEHYPHPKAVLLGEMLELGNESEAEHQKIAEMVLSKSFDVALLVGENFRKAAAENHLTFFATPEEAGAFIQSKKLSGYHLLIKGSRGIKMEKVLNNL